MKTGIYYNETTKEITSLSNGAVLPGAGWKHVTDEAQLGLMAIRAMLEERGIVEDGSVIYWHLPQPKQAGGPALVCEPPEKKATGRLSRMWSSLRGNRRQQLPTSSARASP